MMTPESTAGRPRARELGITIGHLESGAWNAITDVPGVRVGHTTLIHEEAILNALCAATTTTGIDGRVAHALPHDQIRKQPAV